MYTLGLNAYHPDSSACIIKDGELICAAEEERFCRIKHWAGFPKESIRYCLKEADISLKDLDFISVNRSPHANLHKKAFFALKKGPSFSLIKSRVSNLLRIGGIKETLCKEFLSSGQELPAKVCHVEHHRAHLASAFFVSPFEKSTVVSVDGFGDFTSCMVAKGEGNRIDVLYEVNYPHSLGILYTALTQFLGFKKFGDEYKVMALAAYGEPKYLKRMEEILIIKPQGRFVLNLDYFSFYKENNSMLWENTEPTQEDVFSKKFIDLFGTPRRYEEEIASRHYDLAATLQALYEKAFFHILNYAYEITGNSNVCLAGGCALNSVANGKIFDFTPFKEVYIQPASSDAGGSVGAGYYLYHQVLGHKRKFIMKNAYWGPGFSNDEIREKINEYSNELKGCCIENVADQNLLCRKTAEFISQGKIVGWFQGRMEWGPRALGNRSILADPRGQEIKDILNSRIKKREQFRPFAPSILLENVSEYFEKSYPDPFMIKVYLIKEDKRAVIPAVAHVDGSGRLQTVSKEENPLFWNLIKEFEGITGIPVILNTSFNENEPIVCKPYEAIDCFLRTKMDVLVLGNYLIAKNPC